ncbi:unnamed protein product [Meganyctiphanes norvegica]|uniref:Major facilitator superfamily (MFS) profile domain-containing protein n=1 Tax=Meganyctiphanes norvegica TaxID=48144 RepID=A0AAV2S071_MEGNR
MEAEDPVKVSTAPPWKSQGYIPNRYLVAVLTSIGMGFNYILRVNINLAIVGMVNKPHENLHHKYENTQGCAATFNTTKITIDYIGDFEWDEWTQGLITGSFYWGYIWTHIPGGRFAEKWSARYMIGGAWILASLISCLLPLAAKYSSTMLIIMRVALGAAEGVTFPSVQVLLASWSPPLERSILSTIVFIGSYAGVPIAYTVVAAIMPTLGWEAAFYIPAGATFAWTLLWLIFVSDHPHTSRFITSVEKNYITTSIGDSKSTEAPPVPWKSLLTSMPFWSIIVAGLGNNWGFYILLTDLPLYMKEILHMDLSLNAVLSSMPFVGFVSFGLFFGFAGDFLRQRGYISTTFLRKAAIATGHLIPAICLVGLSFVECDTETTIALLFFAVTINGAVLTGWVPNAVDIAPNFSGTTFGIINAISTIPGWLAPMAVGAIVNNQQTIYQWRKVFYMSAGIFIADMVFFLLFASGEEQPWNKVKKNDHLQSDTDENQCESGKIMPSSNVSESYGTNHSQL